MIYISGLCLYHVSMKVSAGSTSADGGGATGDFSEAVRVCLVLCQQRLVQKFTYTVHRLLTLTLTLTCMHTAPWLSLIHI